MNARLISCIIPAYNAARHLPQLAEGVFWSGSV